MKQENKLMLADLKRSGLTEQDAKKLKLKALTSVNTYKLVNQRVESYLIPYYDVDGKPTDFYRIRLTGEAKGFGSKSKMRYTQPPNMPPQFYYSKSINWKKIKSNVEIPIVFTEGEKKAAVLCKHKINCIGLGGVWNWKSKSSWDGLSKDYHDIAWEGREVYITFDSDIMTNPHIQKACYALSMQLLKDGAIVNIQHIPCTGGVKMGVDDFILEHGIQAFRELDVEEFELSKALHEMNSNYIYCASPPMFIELDSMFTFKRFDFMSHVAPIRHPHINASGNLINAPAFDAWIQWPKRNQCKGIAFEPGEGEITADNKLNTFKSDSVQPVKPTKGQLKPFHDFVKFIFENESPEVLKHFLQWAAYPFQYPGNKIYHCVLIQSVQTGVGKSLLGHVLGKLYGDNFVEGGSKILDGDFNGWAKNKRFVLVDEISSENNGAKQRKESNHIKNLITQETIEINIKNQAEYDVNDYLHYILTSNHPNAVYLEPNDRRFLIISAPIYTLPDTFYTMFDTWYRDIKNQRALMYYLMYDVDLDGFNPKAAPPCDSSHAAMVETSRTDVESWCNELKEVPVDILQLHNTPLTGDLWTIKDLNQLYQSQTHDNIRNKALSLKLLDISIPFIQVTNPRRTYFVIRNADRWVGKKSVEYHKHYESTRGVKKDSRFIAPINKGKSK